MRVRSLLLGLPLLILAGCGGSDDDGGCGTDTALRPDARYVGQYAATYTPSAGATGGSREFRLSVVTDGTVGGFARNPAGSAEFESVVSGRALNTSDACGTGITYLDLNFTLPGGTAETLNAQRDTKDTLIGSFRIVGVVDGKPATLGTLVVTPVIETEG